MRTPDVLIAGAGIIGLSAALELAQHGLRVVVLDQGRAMRGASHAAAGMLAAQDPENPPELRPMAALSLQLYPAFLATIERLSGLPVPLRTSFTLQGSAQRALVQGAGQAAPTQMPVPELQTGRYRFDWLEEQSLDPRDLCAALPQAAQAAGVAVVEDCAVHRVTLSQGGALLETTRGSYAAPRYIHACGAWAGLAEFAKWGLPVEPRKGQMLRITLPPGSPQLCCVVRTPELYLVPRGDGGVVVGATVERAGFDCGVTRAAAQALWRAAAALWPPLVEGKVTEHWAGLRPGTPDGLPILDRLPSSSGMPDLDRLSTLDRTANFDDAPAAAPPAVAGTSFVATGHFRNGILLAPGTARLLRQWVTGLPAELDTRAFRLARFRGAAAPSDNAHLATL